MPTSHVRVWDKHDESVRVRGLNQATVVDRYNHPEYIEQGFWVAERDVEVIGRWATATSAEALRETDTAALSRWITMAILRHRFAGFAGQSEINAVLLMKDGSTRRGTGSDGIAIQKMLADAAHDGVPTRAGTPVDGQPPVVDLSMWEHIAVVPIHDGSLITGDAMVDLILGPDGRRAGAVGLLLPLSPSRLLIGARYGNEFQFDDLRVDTMDVTDPNDPAFLSWVRRLADLSNVHVAGASRRFVVSTPDSEVLGASAGPLSDSRLP
ncbi:hypothetical protein [Subtercola boreus]|uniref:hypothetical protein n=1 Tax=Subtercola boreus TaxID=120213 RepID=UPI0011C07BC4|nr:hypothetical protein [Subtercola boreus]